MAKKLDTWVRWSHRVNGWMWSVMRGAEVVVEGSAPSQDEAERLANKALLSA